VVLVFLRLKDMTLSTGVSNMSSDAAAAAADYSKNVIAFFKVELEAS
jgi:hypothetical protein